MLNPSVPAIGGALPAIHWVETQYPDATATIAEKVEFLGRPSENSLFSTTSYWSLE
jgi:hypothetical protein